MPLVTLSLLISIFLSVPGISRDAVFRVNTKKAAAETPPPLSII